MAAGAIIESVVANNAPTYLIEIPGWFSPVGPFGGSGSSCTQRPRYKVAVFIVLKSTFEVVISGLQQSVDDLSKLGAVHVDRLRSGPLFPPAAETTTSPGSEGANCKSIEAANAFVALAQKGADNTFTATYNIPAQQNSGLSTLTVAHLASADSTSPTSGTWMFEVDRIASGSGYLWVSHPHSTDVCTRRSRSSAWSCYQTSLTYPQGNGWFLSTGFYLPVSEFYGIQSAVRGAKPSSMTTTRSVVDGLRVECLSVVDENNGAHLDWCITSTGVVASFSADPAFAHPGVGGVPADGTLSSDSSSLPAATFSLPAKPTIGKGIPLGGPGN
jgi:hypothetical protein